MISPETNPPKDDELKLVSLLNQQTIQAKVFVRDWEGAVDRAGQLLLDSGSIEPAYIEAMKRVLTEMGPYAVIAPGIVLLHARPEDGVKRPCLALISLSIPVEFGHSENDPVDLVFALGATDKQSHIQALQQLANLLGDEAMLSRIRSALDPESMVSMIQSWLPQD